MGTRGLKALRHRGKYYIIYNHQDSYPEGLGKDLVENVPTEPDKYKAWLQLRRTFYVKLAETLEKEFLVVSDSDMRLSKRFQRKMSSLLEYNTYQLPSSLPPMSDGLLINYIWTIDLDREVFSCDNGAHFHLDKIPRQNDQWEKALAKDESGRRILDYRNCPSEAIADLTCPISAPERALLESYKSLIISIVRAKGYKDFSKSVQHRAAFLALIFQQFSNEHRQTFENCLLGWYTEEFVFQEFAFAILCLACGNSQSLCFEDVRCIMGAEDTGGFRKGYGWTKQGSGKQRKKYFLPVLAVGCHLKDVEPGSAPRSKLYWFEGVLISVTAQLGRSIVIEIEIAKVIEYAHSEGHQTFNAVLISIEHVSLVKVVGNSIQHTEPIPLIRIPVHMTEDPRNTGGWSMELEDDLFEEDREMKVLSSTPLERIVEPGEEFRTSAGFMALIHMFDSASKQALKPSTGFNEGYFPAEIYHLIMEHADLKTYNTFAKVSRNLRQHCQENLRVETDATIVGYQASDCFEVKDRNHGNRYTVLVSDHFDIKITDSFTNRPRRGVLQPSEETTLLAITGSDRPSLLWNVGFRPMCLGLPQLPRDVMTSGQPEDEPTSDAEYEEEDGLQKYHRILRDVNEEKATPKASKGSLNKHYWTATMNKYSILDHGHGTMQRRIDRLKTHSTTALEIYNIWQGILEIYIGSALTYLSSSESSDEEGEEGQRKERRPKKARRSFHGHQWFRESVSTSHCIHPNTLVFYLYTHTDEKLATTQLVVWTQGSNTLTLPDWNHALDEATLAFATTYGEREIAFALVIGRLVRFYRWQASGMSAARIPLRDYEWRLVQRRGNSEGRGATFDVSAPDDRQAVEDAVMEIKNRVFLLPRPVRMEND
ncbi:MAG: hypothetical protein M1827_004737 [Pycnora praestabilis]|nr:MAG: hypothetical protein M1827_004737 [Pycnora praestabilis]